ncbi:homoserine O-acetyltransferase [Piptocephalis cylindrospora]|uniref:Homoserine O-acetyltransferase n=1 Tax=Piptocephalis cylindrospora TaxID=1907219 RepID=A0A4P9Y1C9_9FUNG|nr:homoserine O-acetyltransferase [Piptocephalis cylindrospora]|eukprot:RKP12474.1 homoserine O-acetyltransferase [Piptocephalis cylindrospora]
MRHLCGPKSLGAPLVRAYSKNAPIPTQLSFPCVDQTLERTRSLDGGPEPLYDRIVTGYQVYQHPKPLILYWGGVLQGFDLAYETWGELNARKDNAILLHTGLSGSSHARSHGENEKPGWWESFIGPGRPIDTNRFHVICTNVLGGCYGSTGPSSALPGGKGGERYATRFPPLTIPDMVRAQLRLLDQLGIERLHASVGSSMGGMQSLCLASMAPDRVGRVVSISAAARSHPYSIALRHTQRQVLMSDPHWNKGHYYGGVLPHAGMKLAREVATISYRSGPEWERRFGRKRVNPQETPALCADFLIETYLDHQGERFCLQFDPNSLLYISRAMDLFDMSAQRGREARARRLAASEKHEVPLETEDVDIEEVGDGRDGEDVELVRGMSRIHHPTLVLGVQSDILFPHWQQQEIARSLRRAGNSQVTHYELDAEYGHDTFLIDTINVGAAVKGHLEQEPGSVGKIDS